MLDPIAKRIMDTFAAEGVECRIAGGWVRDQLLNKVSSDIDLAIAAEPETIVKIAAKNRWKAVPTGIDHGTVTLVFGGRHFEVTSCREDVVTDGRHAVVKFGSSFEADALRRDFTVNALFCDRFAHIHDYVGGLQDLKNKILRFVGEPETRIKEDYLRGLRFFRFLGQLDFTPDALSLEGISRQQAGFPLLSRERLTQEARKLLQCPEPDAALRLLGASGLWEFVILTPVPATLSLNLPVADQRHAFTWLARVAALWSLQEKPFEPLIKAWKLSRKEGEWLLYFESLLKTPPITAEEGALALAAMEKSYGDGLFADGPIAYLEKWTGQSLTPLCLKYNAEQRHAPLPVDGTWLQENLGVVPGPEIKKKLLMLKYSYLKREWLKPEDVKDWLKSKGEI